VKKKEKKPSYLITAGVELHVPLKTEEIKELEFKDIFYLYIYIIQPHGRDCQNVPFNGHVELAEVHTHLDRG